MLAPSPLLAAPRDDVKAGVSRCDGIGDDRAWLDCFYGAAQPMRARLGLSPAPDFQQRLVPSASGVVPAAAPRASVAPPAAPARQKEGGFLSALVGNDDLEDRQPMTAYSFDHAGLFTVTLTDGSIWQQIPGDGIRAGWRGPASGYVVTVSKGALGSTSLTIPGTGVNYRVRQIK